MRLAVFVLVLCASVQGQEKRAMGFRDELEVRRAESVDISKDGKRAVYALSVPDWKAGQTYRDLYLVTVGEGVRSTRQLTFTPDKNESSPRWSEDGRRIAFLSDREGGRNQLYLMVADGGEARRISSGGGVSEFAFSEDGKWLAYEGGREEEHQLWLYNLADESGKPTQLTKHPAGILKWAFSKDSGRIYFTARDEMDKDDRQRREKKFTAELRNAPTPLAHLWQVTVGREWKAAERLTGGKEFSVAEFRQSPNGERIAFRGESAERYKRGITEAGAYADLYELQVASRAVKRLTDNVDIGESLVSYSPDGKWMAFSASDDFRFFRNYRVYVRPAEGGGEFRKLGTNFDGDVRVDFWSKDGKMLYFEAGMGATSQAMAMPVDTGKVSAVTKLRGVLTVERDEDSGMLVVRYGDAWSPGDVYLVASAAELGDREKWVRLTDSNPQVKQFALGTVETVQWKSTDGRTIEGVLTKPVGFERGKRYPLIVRIHGGPAGADTLRFQPDVQVYAGAGYLVLQPNYRGSTNYGERHKTETSGDYFRLGYDDIMTGVDYLIGQGLADGDKMGAMGWSAGGHYSNWILTHTDRFKAISTGAGAVNWLSMYAQSDVQRTREFYFGGVPYDRPEELWNMSPLKYIKNAKTPTLIHCVDGDPRVPRPQSDELHMALKKLGVPVEYLVYPGKSHGIPDLRNRMVKAMAEMAWFEKYIRGKQKWLEWRDLLQTLEEGPAVPAAVTDRSR